MLKAAKNMRGKLALLYRVTGRPGHRLHIFLNSTYELKLILCIPFTMLKAAKNMRGKLALLYRVTGRPGHRLHIFLNSTYAQKTGIGRPVYWTDLFVHQPTMVLSRALFSVTICF